MRKSLEYQGMTRREIRSVPLENIGYELDLEGFEDGYGSFIEINDLLILGPDDPNQKLLGSIMDYKK